MMWSQLSSELTWPIDSMEEFQLHSSIIAVSVKVKFSSCGPRYFIALHCVQLVLV